jgi:hypothetical protein
MTYRLQYETGGKSPNESQNSSPMIATLLILGGAVSGVRGLLHTIYTLLDLRNPRRPVPVDPSVAHAMANSALRLSGGRTDMWRAWIGLTLATILRAAAGCRSGALGWFRFNTLPVGIIMPALTLIECVYLVLALLYRFRAPAIG